MTAGVEDGHGGSDPVGCVLDREELESVAGELAALVGRVDAVGESARDALGRVLAALGRDGPTEGPGSSPDATA